MSELDRFNDTTGADISSFTEGVRNTTGLNKGTSEQRASYAAILEGKSDSTVQAYQQIKADLMTTGSSPRAEAVSSEVAKDSLVADQYALRDMVTDEQVPFEDKKAAAYSVIDKMNARPNLRDQLSQRNLEADSKGENAEMETVRINTAASIQEVNRVKREKQIMLNKALIQNSPNTQEAIIGFLEYLVPFTESKRLSTLVNDFNGQEDFVERSKTFADITLFTGSDKKELINTLRRMSPADQLQASQALVDAINNSSELVLPDENDISRMDFLTTFLEDGSYTTTDEWIDNVVSVLDLTVIGGAAFRLLRAGKTLVRPTSVAENMASTNPEKAKAMHSMAMEDSTGEAAEVAYGASRGDVAASDLGFEIDEAGSVKAKVGNMGSELDQRITPDPEVMDSINSDGAIYYWEDEKRQARSRVYNDFRNPTGLRARDEMNSVAVDEANGLSINSIYGPTEGGFAAPQEAFDVTEFALRKYGVTGKDITIMAQVGDEYKEISPETLATTFKDGVRPAGGFLAKVNYKYTINPLDIEEMAKADVKWNLFDRIAGAGTNTQGSLQRHILDAHSMLHPNITKGASVAVDKAAGLEKSLLELGERFTEGFNALSKERKALLHDYILEANDKGIAFNKNRLIADGYKPEEIQALADWRGYWDTVYTLENRDLSRTLTHQGYKVLEDKVTDSRFFAKPVARQSIGNAVEVYDVASDTVRQVTKPELDELYQGKGTVAKLKDPIDKNGDIAEYVISKEDSGNFLRRLSDHDEVLNYRKGYYSVNYTAPKYIVQRVKDKSGKVRYEKAVSMAGNSKDADLAARRMATTQGKRYDNVDPDADFFVRDNVKDGRGMDTDYSWSIQSSAGRSAQRIRGERLVDASGENTLGQKEWVMGPTDSLIHSARNLSRRASMRDYLETTKTRFIEQYKDVLPLNQYGQPSFPNKRSEIGKEGRMSNKLAADARTTYEYIKSLEDGYINGMDEAYKASLKLIGNILGGLSTKVGGKAGKALSVGEEIFQAGSEMRGPTGFGKNVAFQAYLASNPLRQILVQSHQHILLLGINPSYLASGRLYREINSFVGYLAAEPIVGKQKALAGASKFAGMPVKDFEKMYNAWIRSGTGAAVDKNNLIKGALADAASYNKYGATRSAMEKAVSPITGTLHFSRRIGFDAGEYFNSLASWLTYHDKVSKTKKGVLDNADYDNISAQARNIALNMNQAGEMPYNQNALGLFFQFIQVPHKMMTTMTTNRALSWQDKTKLAGLNFTLFGVGSTAAYNLFGSLLPEDGPTRDIVVNGLESFLINETLSQAFNEDVNIDFSSLAPSDMYGLSTFMTELWTGNPGDILAASPAGSLFFGNNPRITKAFKRAAQYFHLMEDSGDPVELAQVFKSFASISSGYSSYYKAKMAQEYGRKRSSLGGVVDDNVTSIESMAQLFGMGTQDEIDLYFTNTKGYESSQAFADDFKLWYKDMKMRLVEQGVNPEDSEFSLRVMNAGLNAFEGNKPRFQQLLLQQLRYDVEVDKDYRLYKSAIQSAGFMDREELKKYMNALPFEDEENKQQIMEILNYQREEVQE